MQRADSLEKTLVLGKTEGKRRREHQRMRWLDGIINSVIMNLNNLREIMGEGSGTPLQYSCLENPMDGGAWWAAVHGVAKSRTRISDFTFTFPFSCIGEGNGNPLQCSCLESQGRGSLVGCRLWGRTELDTTEAT